MSGLIAARRAVLAKPRSVLAVHARWASTTGDKDKYKVVVVGAGMYSLDGKWFSSRKSYAAGSGGLTVANQIYNRFKAAGTPLNKEDIAVVDAAEYHYYQVSALTSRIAWLNGTGVYSHQPGWSAPLLGAKWKLV